MDDLFKKPITIEESWARSYLKYDIIKVKVHT